LSSTPSSSSLTCGRISQNVTLPSSSQTATISCSSTKTGGYSLTITGTSASLVHKAVATFNFVNFTVAANTATADVGHPANLTITVTAQNNFAGTVDLSTAPTGLSCAFNPTSVMGSGTSKLSCISSTAGSYFVTVKGFDGTLTNTAGAALVFVDFVVSATTPLTPNVGSLANSTITVTPVFGFSRVVVFSDAPLPNGLTCVAFNPSSVTGLGTTVLSCSSATSGSYTVTVSGTDHVLSRATTITFSFVAPSLGSVSLSSHSVTIGSKVVVPVSVTNNAPISQKMTVQLRWGAITVNSTDVTLGPGEQRTVTLSWDTSQYGPGTANVTVAIPQTGSIQNAGPLTLNSPSQPVLSGGLPLVLGAVGVGVAAVVGAAVFLLRRSRTVTAAESSTL
jgi:hypothetical protein